MASHNTYRITDGVLENFANNELHSFLNNVQYNQLIIAIDQYAQGLGAADLNTVTTETSTVGSYWRIFAGNESTLAQATVLRNAYKALATLLYAQILGFRDTVSKMHDDFIYAWMSLKSGESDAELAVTDLQSVLGNVIPPTGPTTGPGPATGGP
jgi:hypothetical protein